MFVRLFLHAPDGEGGGGASEDYKRRETVFVRFFLHAPDGGWG